jgi:UDP-N-acetylmuramyl pentapeptide phosphotransferase/UDP-N-acetylglucosamine-1-phosphate transferase
VIMTWRVMIEWIFIVAAAALLSAGLIALLRPLLVRYALARPNARSSHKIPTPQGGGAAVIAATLMTAAAIVFFRPPSDPAAATTFAILAAVTLGIAIIGAVDDINPLGTLPRLAAQAVAAVIVVSLLPMNHQIAPLLPWWIERVALVLAGVWFVNLVNFMDGIDWMTVAEVTPVTGGLALLAYFGALPALETVIALTLLGATIGFAPFNRPVAKLFLGDVGSLPIGLLLFWMLLQLANHGHLAAALLLPLYYVADATTTLLRRLMNGEPITQAHRDHFYQRATARGISVLQVVRRVFLTNLVLAVLALATVIRPSWILDIGAFIIGCASVAWLLFGFVQGKARPEVS